MRGAAYLVSASVAAFVCACSPEPPQPDPADLMLARQAALAFDQRLKKEIVDRLERGEDPIAVYLAYRDNVPSYARRIAEQLGVEFDRVSLRPRNPSSLADEWEEKKIEEFQFWREAGVDPDVMETAEILEEDGVRVFRWLRPVSIGEPCMVCHGDAIEARILKLLAQEYPLDGATGYYETEIVGAYSVRKALGED